MTGVSVGQTGDMLREAVAAGSEVGKKAKAVMDSGGLVRDDIVIGIIKDRTQNPDCVKDFILHRFPRSFAQGKAMDALLKETGEAVNCVVEFNVPDVVPTKQICGRWIHKGAR